MVVSRKSKVIPNSLFIISILFFIADIAKDYISIPETNFVFIGFIFFVIASLLSLLNYKKSKSKE